MENLRLAYCNECEDLVEYDICDELIEEEGFSAVFIGSGAGLPKFMGIPGEQANGVFSANEYLTRSNLMKAFDENSATRHSVHLPRYVYALLQPYRLAVSPPDPYQQTPFHGAYWGRAPIAELRYQSRLCNEICH